MGLNLYIKPISSLFYINMKYNLPLFVSFENAD